MYRKACWEQFPIKADYSDSKNDNFFPFCFMNLITQVKQIFLPVRINFSKDKIDKLVVILISQAVRRVDSGGGSG